MEDTLFCTILTLLLFSYQYALFSIRFLIISDQAWIWLLKDWSETLKKKWTRSQPKYVCKYVNQSLVDTIMQSVMEWVSYLKIDAKDFQNFSKSPCKSSPKIQFWKDKRSKVATGKVCNLFCSTGCLIV